MWGLGYGRSMERPLRDLGLIPNLLLVTLSPHLPISPSLDSDRSISGVILTTHTDITYASSSYGIAIEEITPVDN